MKNAKSADLAMLIRKLQQATQASVKAPALVNNQQRATVAVVFETSAGIVQRQAVDSFLDSLKAVSQFSCRTLLQEISHGIKCKLQWALANLSLYGAKAPVEIEVINPSVDGAKASVVLAFNSEDRKAFLKCLCL